MGYIKVCMVNTLYIERESIYGDKYKVCINYANISISNAYMIYCTYIEHMVYLGCIYKVYTLGVYKVHARYIQYLFQI